VRAQCRVRICKGAYKEPPEVAYPEKADVDRSFVRAMHALMRDGRYPGIATHDEAIIAEAKRFAKAEGIPPDRYEFQMLYGVRRDLQEQLVSEGYRMRLLRALRHAVVPVPHAPPRRAPGEHDVHGRQRDEGAGERRREGNRGGEGERPRAPGRAGRTATARTDRAPRPNPSA
jgi:hypothetical protein